MFIRRMPATYAPHDDGAWVEDQMVSRPPENAATALCVSNATWETPGVVYVCSTTTSAWAKPAAMSPRRS